MHQEPTNGGLPYRSWDRMGRDVVMAVVTAGIGLMFTTLTAMSGRIQDIHRMVDVNTSRLATVASIEARFDKALDDHVRQGSHTAAAQQLGRIEANIENLRRDVEGLRERVDRVAATQR